jgi:hypothetical protein
MGLVFEKALRHLFAFPSTAAVFLCINGAVLFAGERLRRCADTAGDRRGMAETGWRDALLVGFFQAAALFPGISRSGATMVGGLLIGLRHEDAARFSFLLATPIIIGASVLEIPKLLHAPAGEDWLRRSRLMPAPPSLCDTSAGMRKTPRLTPSPITAGWPAPARWCCYTPGPWNTCEFLRLSF